MQRHVQAFLVLFLAILGSLPLSAASTAFAWLPPIPGLLYEIAIAAAALIGWIRWQRMAWDRALARESQSWRVLGLATLCNLALGASYHWWIPPTSVPLLDRLDGSTVRNATVVIMACITGPLLEEALFRGPLLSRLRRTHGATTGVLLSAVAFGIAHGEATRILQPLLGGIILGAIAVCTGRLWLAAATHSLFNLSGLLEVLAQHLELPDRLGLLYPIISLVLAVVSAVELRRVLVTTRWFIAPTPASLVAPPATWGLDSRV